MKRFVLMPSLHSSIAPTFTTFSQFRKRVDAKETLLTSWTNSRGELSQSVRGPTKNAGRLGPT